MTVTVLINVDVPDLEAAIAFFTTAFGLAVGRPFGRGAAELTGWPAPLFLLSKKSGSIGAGESRRTYERHWTPVHLDIIVEEIEVALSRSRALGRRAPWSSRRSALKHRARLRCSLTRSRSASAPLQARRGAYPHC